MLFAEDGGERVTETRCGKPVEAVIDDGEVDPGVGGGIGDVHGDGVGLFGQRVFRQGEAGVEAARAEVGTEPAQADGAAVARFAVFVPGVGEQPDAVFPVLLPRDLQLCLSVFEGGLVVGDDVVAVCDFDGGPAVKGRAQVEHDGVARFVFGAVGAEDEGGRVVFAAAVFIAVPPPAVVDGDAGGGRRLFALHGEDVAPAFLRQVEGGGVFAVGGEAAAADGFALFFAYPAPAVLVVTVVAFVVDAVERPVQRRTLLFATVIDNGDVYAAFAAFQGGVGGAARQEGGAAGINGAAVRRGDDGIGAQGLRAGVEGAFEVAQGDVAFACGVGVGIGDFLCAAVHGSIEVADLPALPGGMGFAEIAGDDAPLPAIANTPNISYI